MVIIMSQTNDSIIEHPGNLFFERFPLRPVLHHPEDAVFVDNLCCFTHLSYEVQYCFP